MSSNSVKGTDPSATYPAGETPLDPSLVKECTDQLESLKGVSEMATKVLTETNAAISKACAEENERKVTK